jgi:hypothetical protein
MVMEESMEDVPMGTPPKEEGGPGFSISMCFTNGVVTFAKKGACPMDLLQSIERCLADTSEEEINSPPVEGCP